MRRLIGPLLVFVLISCSDNTETPKSDPFQGFFPLIVGTYQLYDVEDIQIQQNVQTRSVYELKEAVTDSFKNEEGGYTYVISRHKRTDGSQPWTFLETWSSRLTNRQVIVNEGNTAFVRAIIPVVKGQKWNGNEFNTLVGDDACGNGTTFTCDQFEITAINESFQSGSLTVANSLVVTEENDPDILVKNDVRKKVYAKDVGLVYVESTVLNYCTTPPSCYGTQFVNTGRVYKQTWKSSGQEN